MSKHNGITYYWGDHTLLISLGNRTNRRIRALYLIEFLFLAAMATVFLLQSLPLTNDWVHWVACLGASFIYLIAANRFLARMFFTERLLLDSLSITIIKKTLFSQNIKRYDWRQIGTLHYEGKSRKTDHPLKGMCYDYLGFETQEQLIQSLHHNGNLYFDTNEGRVYFASGVYSWDAEEMVQLMKVYIGSSLQLGPEWAEMLQGQD